MRRPTNRLFLPVVVLVVGCLAGCGSSITSSISLPSRSAAPSVTVPVRPTTAVTTAAPPSTQVTTAAPTAPAVASSSPGASSSSNLLWLWILLGVLVVVGLVALIARSSRRRRVTAAGWQSRLIDAYAKGSALHDAMSVAEAPGGLFAPDAAARWADIQRRADDLAQTLYALREAVPPDSSDRVTIADTLASLQAVRSAMEAERTPGGAGPQQAEVVRSRLFSFESCRRALRASDQGAR